MREEVEEEEVDSGDLAVEWFNRGTDDRPDEDGELVSGTHLSLEQDKTGAWNVLHNGRPLGVGASVVAALASALVNAFKVKTTVMQRQFLATAYTIAEDVSFFDEVCADWNGEDEDDDLDEGEDELD